MQLTSLWQWLLIPMTCNLSIEVALAVQPISIQRYCQLRTLLPAIQLHHQLCYCNIAASIQLQRHKTLSCASIIYLFVCIVFVRTVFACAVGIWFGIWFSIWFGIWFGAVGIWDSAVLLCRYISTFCLLGFGICYLLC